MFKYYNPNPQGKAVGDCTIRALSKALKRPWEGIYLMLAVEGFLQSDMPSANAVWGAVLSKSGFARRLPETEISVDDFAADNPAGTFVLALSNHVVYMQDGTIYDTWDSGKETVIYLWEEI